MKKKNVIKEKELQKEGKKESAKEERKIVPE